MKRLPYAGFALIVASMVVLSDCDHSPPATETRLYERNRSGRVFEQASLIQAGSFSEARLADSFTKLVVDKTPRFRVIRWIAGVREKDLLYTLPFPGCWFENPSHFNGDWFQNSTVAQFIYVDGTIVEQIKDREKITQRTLKGKANPLDFNVDGTRVQLKSFHINGARDPEPLVQFFGTARPLPSPQQAVALLRTLLTIADLHEATLAIRTDSIFGRYDGPGFDVFQAPYEDVDEPAYLSRPYLGCGMARPGGDVTCKREWLQPRSPIVDCM